MNSKFTYDETDETEESVLKSRYSLTTIGDFSTVDNKLGIYSNETSKINYEKYSDIIIGKDSIYENRSEVSLEPTLLEILENGDTESLDDLILIDNLSDKSEWVYDELCSPFDILNGSNNIGISVRQITAQTMGQQLVPVQPMSLPTSQLMYVDYNFQTPTPPMFTQTPISVKPSMSSVLTSLHPTSSILTSPTRVIKKPIKRWKNILGKVIKKARNLFN